MLSFFWRIVRDHYGSLPVGISVSCHVAPLIIVLPVAWGFKPTENQLGAVISAVSIYSALLFSILVPAGDQARRMKEQYQASPDDGLTESKLKRRQITVHRKVARNILSNVAFSIVVSLLAVLALIVSLCLTPKDGKFASGVSKTPLEISLYVSGYLFFFVLMVLMVVVRTTYGSLMEESA